MKPMTQEEALSLDKRLLDLGLDILSLIEVAGFSAFEVLSHILKEKGLSGPVAVIVGPGNNGSDGLVIARYLCYSGYRVTVICKKCKHANLLEVCRSAGATIVESANLGGFGVVVDSLFGFSFKGSPREPYLEYLRSLRSAKNVISIDVPSGCTVDKEVAECGFVPLAVICYAAPKPCCLGFNFYLTRSFFPPLKGYSNNYDRFESHCNT